MSSEAKQILIYSNSTSTEATLAALNALADGKYVFVTGNQPLQHDQNICAVIISHGKDTGKIREVTNSVLQWTEQTSRTLPKIVIISSAREALAYKKEPYSANVIAGVAMNEKGMLEVLHVAGIAKDVCMPTPAPLYTAFSAAAKAGIFPRPWERQH